MESYEDLSAGGVGFVARKDLLIPSWGLPGAQAVGSVRAICRGIRGVSSSAALVVMPFGQASPRHNYEAEHLFLGIRGEVRFETDTGHFDVGELDLLYIGADVDYVYRNIGLEDALFADIIGRIDEWPAAARYQEPGQ